MAHQLMGHPEGCMDAVWSVLTVRPINSSYVLTVLAHELMGLLMGYPIGGMGGACMCTMGYPLYSAWANGMHAC